MNDTKPPIIITFASSKGGVGKSTTCAAIAGALAHRGKSVALIDLDQNQTLHRWFTRHQPDVPGLNCTDATPDLFLATLEKLRRKWPDFILIDIAGAYEATMIKAIAASDLVITPAKLSEPDLREAWRILSEVDAFNNRFKADIRHRVLVNEADALDPGYQRHALAELDSSALTRFHNIILRRAAYREIFITGQPPHFAEQSRPPIRKAVAELDAITDEIVGIASGAQEAAA